MSDSSDNIDENYSDDSSSGLALVNEPQSERNPKAPIVRESSSEYSDSVVENNDDSSTIRVRDQEIRRKRTSTGNELRNRYPKGELPDSQTFEQILKSEFQQSLNKEANPVVFANCLKIDDNAAIENVKDLAIEEFAKLYTKLLKQRSYDGKLFFYITL